MAQRIGLVLAGGRARRMGRDKGAIVVSGRSLADRAVRALWPLCGDVLVSLGVDTPSPVEGRSVVRDAPPPGRGPLAGIQAGFRAAGSADLLVLACDYPYVSTAFLRRVAAAARDHDDLVMPYDLAGRDHPLLALWRRSAAPAVDVALSEGRYKVRALLAELRVRRLGPQELSGADVARELHNANFPEDLPVAGLPDPTRAGR